MIKMTEKGRYLCMNEPDPDEERIKQFKLDGARVSQSNEKCNWRKMTAQHSSE